MSDDGEPDPTQLQLEIHFQNALLLYKQNQRLKEKEDNKKLEPRDPPPTDLSLSTNKNNILVVDGYVRSISNSIQRYIPQALHTLIKAFYPRAHHIAAIGWNHYGEMAVGHNQPIAEFKALDNFQILCDDYNDIHPGWKRFIVRNCFNELYCVGRNMENDLGIDFTPKPNEVSRFQKMKPLKNESHYKTFSGNFSFHTFLLSSSYNLYAFGQNGSSQCGYKATNENAEEKQASATPVLLVNCIQIFGGEYITKICCGDNFSLFLTQNGHVFSCGNNRFGSCGFPINNNMYKQVIHRPTRIVLDDEVKMMDINCGGRHVICISNDHNVWCFGQNLFHQLGFGTTYDHISEDSDHDDRSEEDESNVDKLDTGCPTMNPYFINKSIIKTVCGFSHTLAIEDNGNAYFFGRNHKAQCGKFHNGNFSKLDTIQTPFLFQSISFNETGDSFLYNLDEKGRKLRDFDESQPFTNVKIRDGSGGYEHTILITRDNQLIGFGGNGSKQCCMQTAKLIVSPSFLDKKTIGLNENQLIERVICGIDTTLIVCSC